MKISREQAATPRRRNLSWYVLLALVFLLGLSLGTQFGRRALERLLSLPTQLARSVGPAEDLSTLTVDMDFSDYNDMLALREEALRAGAYIPAGADFVPATLRLDDDAPVEVRVRWRAGGVDHMREAGGKWGFELRTRQEQQLLGMQRFYLVDPLANNWLGEWAFVRALQREGVLAARYRFVRLVFNGDDRGIYALQESFGGELATSQGRPEGVIVEFDANLLWRSLAHFQGDERAAYADTVANLSAVDFQYFEVDTFQDATLEEDAALSEQRERAIGLLRALQTGQLAASEVFDVALYGRFLALVDLWGATQGTSLVNLRYYYNPASARLEPIGFNANALGSDERISLAATYHDPELQMAYVQEAVRISQPDYLDGLQDELGPEFARLERATRAEHPDGLLLWGALRLRQEQMRRSLAPVQPVFAYLGSPELASEGIMRVEVANILGLPVEVVGFDIDGATVLPANREWLSEDDLGLLLDDPDAVVLRAFDAAQTSVIRYAQFDLPLVEIHRLDSEFDFMREPNVQVITRIHGLSATQMTLAQQGYPDVFVGGEGQ